MYACGPTVYGDPHLGHVRSAMTYDVIYRYLMHLGYKVRYVRNITDVGHLEDEVLGEGEDKIAKKARVEKLEPMEVVQFYTNRYHHFMDRINILRPSIEPSATGHITEQIEVIEKILESGLAYQVNGSVYFDLKKYSEDYEYGRLSGKVLEDLMSGSRDTEGLDEKRNPNDFALWKKAKPEHIMRWPSPWSIGFPGWHLECTSLSTKYLGEKFDIHGGGMDLQFPHHEAEIAQSVGYCGHHSVNYWIHNNLLTIKGQKMSKSLGNFITLEQLFDGSHELLEQAYSPMTLRFFMLQAHYGSPIDFSNEALKAAEKGFNRLMASVSTMEGLSYEKGDINEKLDAAINASLDEVYFRMSDDFNTAQALAGLFDLGSKANAFRHGQLQVGNITEKTFNRLKEVFGRFIKEVLGLEKQGEEPQSSDILDNVIHLLIEMRTEARANKDFATSDKIRDKLAKLGVNLKDNKDGTTFEIG